MERTLNTANKNFTETVTAPELLSQFNILFNKLYHKKNVSPIEQKAGLLKAYKNWVYLNKFQIEFSVSLIGFCELLFGPTLVNSKIPDWAIKKPLSSHTLKEIFTLTEGKQENWKRVLEKFHSNNKSVSVSQNNIEQIFEKDISSKKQSFAKFEHRLTNIKKGNFEKKDLDDFLKTIEKLQVRVVGDVEQYKFKLDVFKNNPDDSYEILKTLRHIMLAWYETRYGELAEDEFESAVYDRFETDVLDEFLRGNLKSNKALASSLDSVFYYLETEVNTLFQLTGLNKNFLNTLKVTSQYSRLTSHYLIQLWAERNNRLRAKALPALSHYCFTDQVIAISKEFKSELTLKNARLFDFLNCPLIDCLVRIQHLILESSSDDEQLSQVLLDCEFELSEVRGWLEDGAVKSAFRLKKLTGLSLDELYELAGYNSSMPSISLIKSTVLVHILLLKNNSDSTSKVDLIEEAFRCEESCLLTSVFLHFNFSRTFGEDIQEVLTESYLKFKVDTFLLAKSLILLCFVNESPSADIHGFITSKLEKIFRKRLPISNKSLLDGKYNEELRDILNVLNISIKQVAAFPFRDVLDEDFNDYERHSYFDACDFNHLTELVYTLDSLIERAWSKLLGSYDREVVFHSFVAHFLNTESVGVTTLVGKDRNEVKNDFKGKYFQDYLKSITTKSFNNITLDFDASLTSSLEAKLEAASNILTLGDDRFRLIYDENNRPVHLGTGGFGCVYKAEDTILESIVAVKLIPKWDDSTHLEKKLLKEAVMMRQCHHPNILTLFDLHSFASDKLVISSKADKHATTMLRQDESVYGLITEYPDSARTLFDIDTAKLSIEDKCNILIQLCDAVFKIHSYGLVHGDIKPSNILIDENLTLKLLDFGSATNVNFASKNRTNSIFLIDKNSSICEAEETDDLYAIGIIAVYLVMPDLIELLVKKAINLSHSVFLAVYLIIDSWEYCKGATSKVLAGSHLSMLLADVEISESNFGQLLSILSSHLIENRAPDIDFLRVAIQLITPFSDDQKRLFDRYFQANNFSFKLYPLEHGYKKFEHAEDAKLSFLRLRGGVSSFEEIRGIKLYGQLLDKTRLENIPFLPASELEVVSSSVAETCLFNASNEVEVDLKEAFYKRLSESLHSEQHVRRLSTESCLLFHLILRDYSADDKFSLDFEILDNPKAEARFEKYGVNTGRAIYRESYIQTMLDFSSIEDEILLVDNFYQLNKRLLLITGWYDWKNRCITSREPKSCNDYCTLLDVYNLVFSDVDDVTFEFRNIRECNLRSLKAVGKNQFSVFSDVLLEYRSNVELLVEDFMNENDIIKLLVYSESWYSIFRKKFDESSSLHEYIKKNEKLPEELSIYLWDVFTKGGSAIENYVLAALSNKTTLISETYEIPDKYALFNIELIVNPEGDYVSRLKEIHSVFSDSSKIQPLVNDLNLLRNWMQCSNYFKTYEIVKRLKFHDIG
jgi:serine/threonine protein kinase